MKLRVAFTRAGKRDLDSLVVHIGEDNPQAAVEVCRRIFKKIDLLGEHSEIGRRGRVAGTRELVVTGTRYIVVYRIDTQRRAVDILRILHAAQMWP